VILQACGPISSFKRLITPANKPQGFGFAEFQEPDGALRALALLNGVELPALEDGCANKKLLVRPTLPLQRLFAHFESQVKADEKTRAFLDMYQSQRMRTEVRFLSLRLLSPHISIKSGRRRGYATIEGQSG
jgi:RNA-binding protein 25